MRENEGKLCLQCGQSLQADTCENCKLLWGCKQLPPELEAFTSYAHNAELTPEKLAELESLISTLPRIAISASKSQLAKRQGLSFQEPAIEKLSSLKSLADFNRRLLLEPDQEFKEGFRRRVCRQLRQLATTARDLGNCEFTKRRAEEIFWHSKDESSEIILWFNEAVSNGQTIAEELLKEAIRLCFDAIGRSNSEPKAINSSQLIAICDRLDAIANGQYAGVLLPLDPDLIIEKTRSELRSFFHHWDHFPIDTEILALNGIEVDGCLALPAFDQEFSRLLKSLRQSIKLTEDLKAESPLLRELNELLLHYQIGEAKSKLYPALAELSRLKSVAGRSSSDSETKTTPQSEFTQQLERLEATVATMKLPTRKRVLSEEKAKKKEVEKDLCIAWETFYNRTHKSKAEFLEQNTEWEPLIRKYFRDEMKKKVIDDILTMVMRIIDRN